jgi:hypothetical protein
MQCVDHKYSLETGHDCLSLRPSKRTNLINTTNYIHTVEPGYNVIDVYDTSSITSDIVLYQLIPHC